jgi:GntR family transcriptional regulator
MVEWSGEPAYKQVEADLRARIAKGEFDATGKLPSLAELQERYKASITVARTAVSQLRAAGLVVSHQGKGAFLVSGAADLARASLAPSGVDELRREVEQVRTELAELRERVRALEHE